LDPNGIIEMRELLKKLNKEHGTTVLVSSHILNEVERMASHVGIIHKGKILFQGTLPELQQMKTKQAALEIETDNNDRAVSLLQQKFTVQVQHEKIMIPYQGKEQTAAVNRQLVQEGLAVYLLQPQHSDLEQLFIDITSNNS
jgi:ABC-2 type transport system ATP-binding protein